MTWAKSGPPKGLAAPTLMEYRPDGCHLNIHDATRSWIGRGGVNKEKINRDADES